MVGNCDHLVHLATKKGCLVETWPLVPWKACKQVSTVEPDWIVRYLACGDVHTRSYGENSGCHSIGVGTATGCTSTTSSPPVSSLLVRLRPPTSCWRWKGVIIASAWAAVGMIAAGTTTQGVPTAVTTTILALLLESVGQLSLVMLNETPRQALHSTFITSSKSFSCASRIKTVTLSHVPGWAYIAMNWWDTEAQTIGLDAMTSIPGTNCRVDAKTFCVWYSMIAKVNLSPPRRLEGMLTV